MPKSLYHATLKKNLPSIKKSGLLLSKVNTGLGLSQNGIYFATDIQTISRIMVDNHKDYVVLRVKPNKVSKYTLIDDPLAFGLEGKAFYTESDVPWEDLEYVGVLSELENAIIASLTTHFGKHIPNYTVGDNAIEGSIGSIKVSIQHSPTEAKVRVAIEGLSREASKPVIGLGFMNPKVGVLAKYISADDEEQIKKVITDVYGVIIENSVDVASHTNGPATKETTQGIEDKSKKDGDKNKTDKVQKHIGNLPDEQPKVTNANKQEGPATKEKVTKILDKSKIVKEKYGEGYSIEINGVEYRYSSTKHSAQEIKDTVDKLMKSSEGKALQWLKANTVNYYGGKDKRTLTSDQKQSRQSKAMPKAEKDPAPQSNKDFENQLKRIEKFADTQVKELDKNPDWTFKYIDDPQEMAELRMDVPGLLLITGFINKDAKELNENPVVKKFNKSKKLKRYRNWFNTTYKGIPAKGIIYIDAEAARSKGVSAIKEAFEDVEFITDNTVLSNKQLYVFRIVDNTVVLMNKNEHISIEF